MSFLFHRSYLLFFLFYMTCFFQSFCSPGLMISTLFVPPQSSSNFPLLSPSSPVLYSAMLYMSWWTAIKRQRDVSIGWAVILLSLRHLQNIFNSIIMAALLSWDWAPGGIGLSGKIILRWMSCIRLQNVANESLGDCWHLVLQDERIMLKDSRLLGGGKWHPAGKGWRTEMVCGVGGWPLGSHFSSIQSQEQTFPSHALSLKYSLFYILIGNVG